MHRRAMLQTLSAGALAAAPGSLLARRVRRDDLQAELTAAIAKFKVPGASVAVFQDGALRTAAAGQANIVTGVTMTPETIMHIGSITKVFNATLVMQLVDEGRLDLDRPLKHYLPDFRVADPVATERITIQMLINHTSGIDGELTPESGHDRERVEDAIPRIATMGQIHAPGAELSYCNSATVLGGYLCQVLTGKSWYDLVKERIFQPLEMRHAIVVPEDALLYRNSVGHFLSGADGSLKRTSFAFLPLSFAPAGATAMMSATDLATFARTHLNDGVAPNGHRLLSAASARRMRTKTASWRGIGFSDVGLGWLMAARGVNHGGGGPGILSWLYADPESGTVVSLLTNAAHAAPLLSEIAAPVLAPLGISVVGADAAAAVKQATDAPVEPGPYAGQYESVATAVRIVPQGRGVALRSRSKIAFYDTTTTEESPPVPLRPIREQHFALGPSVLTFLNPGADGRFGHVAMGGRLLKRLRD